MSNKTYNNITALISFIFTIAFVVGKIIGYLNVSWWYVIVPFILAVVFRAGDDDDNNCSNNNLKMA